MSRCYPFTPPGFVPKEIKKDDESLIESTKKGPKEEVKREKKDRKQNKDKKRKEMDNEAGRSRKHRHHKRQRKDEIGNASKKAELDCLEKSCLTMEFEHQTSSQTSCGSALCSNGNEGPNNIQSQPLNGRQNDSKTSIRVLLHGKGQKHPEVVMTNKDEKQCSSLEILDASQSALSESVEAPLDSSRVCHETTKDPVFDSAIDISIKLSTDKKTNRQTSLRLGKEKQLSRHQEATGPTKLCSKCVPNTAMRFLNLIENWAPDGVESKLNDSEDQELWLLMKVGATKQHQFSNQTRSNGSSSMVWPTAQFLPEAELHALPFTVPF